MPGLPQVSGRAKNSSVQSYFYGYNHNLITNEYEFYDMKNIGSATLPLLSQRKRRGFLDVEITKPQGLLYKNGLIYVDDDKLYYQLREVATLDAPEHKGKERQLISMGARVVIFPDKMMYNTINGELKSLEAKKVYGMSPDGIAEPVTFTLGKLDGSDVEFSTEEPEAPANGTYWIDESSGEAVLKVWSEYQEEWSSVATTYVKICASGIGKAFEVYDAIDISGVTADIGKDVKIEGSYPIWAKGDDWILITAIITKTATQQATKENPIVFYRAVPELDYVVESENRLWGCRWGSQHDATGTVNEIYSCAQGDPTNWNQFLGTSQDSYALGVGSDGEFTGAAVHGGYVMFFKENTIHKIYGSKPSNYQITNVTGRGIMKGSFKSACIVNETLYYLSKNGVCQYAGGIPNGIYAPFGGVRYKNAVGGRCGDRYYISMQDVEGKYHLFTYDETVSMWFKEDDLDVKFFAEGNGILYFIDSKNRLGVTDAQYYDGAIKLKETEGFFDWYAETSDIGMQDPDCKWYSSIQIRLRAAKGSVIKISLQYDSDGKWHEVKRIVPMSTGAYSVDFETPKVDHFKMRIEGRGEAVIYLIKREYEHGSEVRGSYGY